MKDIIKVYAKLDSNNSITEINSSVFLEDTIGFVEIDTSEGKEDRGKYAHAQGNYLENAVFDEQGRPNYKYVDEKIQKLTEEEKEKLYPIIQEEGLTDKERISLLEQAMQDLILSTSNLQGGE